MMLKVAAALFAVMLGACREEAAPTEAAKPTVHVLTSLPLLFDEGFGLEPASGETATFLRDRYRLEAIDLPSKLATGGVLLAAQPRALPAEELVALDAWVRAGGRLVLLADPLLEWPSKRPLGDRMRPPASFADTGLLLHWGLRLDAPDKRGPQWLGGGHVPILFLSPGILVAGRGECKLLRGNIAATCRLGQGTATIVADADWLNADLVSAEGGRFDNQLSELEALLAAPAAR